MPASEKRRESGAKIAMVPVPVRSGRASPVSRTRRMSLRYWYSSCSLDEADGEVEVVVMVFVEKANQRCLPIYSWREVSQHVKVLICC